MSTHSFSVSGEPEAWLNEQVNQGYSKSSIVQEALRLKMERETEGEGRLEAMEVRLIKMQLTIDRILAVVEILKGKHNEGIILK